MKRSWLFGRAAAVAAATTSVTLRGVTRFTGWRMAASAGLIAWAAATQDLDLDRNGVVDFAIERGYWQDPNDPLGRNHYTWWDLVGRGTNTIHTSTNLTLGSPVGAEPASAWRRSDPVRLYLEGMAYIPGQGGRPIYGGLLWERRWNSVFLGLRFTAADGVHYGWVEFRLTQVTPLNYQVNLQASGFQPQPGQPILIGQQPPAQPSGPALPQITQSPAGLSVPAGTDFHLVVVANGNPHPTYQWYLAGQPIPGSIWTILEVNHARLADAGDYHVTVSNSEGSVTSRVAQVFVGYALDLQVQGGGTVQAQPALGLYPAGQRVQLEAIPEAGWRFLGWQGDASGTVNPLTLTMDHHTHIEAVFKSGPGDVKWEFAAGGAVTSCPAIGADGTLYFGAGDRIVALEGGTVRRRWEYRTGGVVLGSPALGAGGMVYGGSEDRKLYGLDAATGQKRWEFLTGGLGFSSPAIGTDGTVYVVSAGGKLFALDGAQGRKLWEFSPVSELAPAIGSDGTVYVGRLDSDSSQVIALNGATGQRRWQFTFNSPLLSSPALGADGTVYVTSGVGVYALDGATGQKRWASPPQGDKTPALAADGTVYVVAGELYALSEATGQIRWHRPLNEADLTPGNPGAPGGPFATPTVGADGTIYLAFGAFGNCRLPEPPNMFPICDSFAVLQALEGGTGRKVWSWNKIEGEPSPPAIGPDGTVYVGAGATLYAFVSSSVGGLAQSPWPKVHGDAQNTGRVSPPAPHLSISWQQGKVRIEWTTPDVLQVSHALVVGVWQDLTEAASPYDVEPANAQRFYRLRRPRRGRCARRTSQPRTARQAKGLRHRSRGQRPRATPDVVHALKGRTNSLAGSLGPGLAWPLQGAKILDGAGSERVHSARVTKQKRSQHETYLVVGVG